MNKPRSTLNRIGFTIIQVILLVFLCFSCKVKRSHPIYPSDSLSCFTKSEKELWLNSILNHKIFQMYLPANQEDHKSIVIRKSDFLNEDLSVKINGSEVKVLDTSNKEENVIDVKVRSYNCAENTISYTLFYSKTNAVISGHTIKIKSHWQNDVYSYFVLDNEP